MPRALMLALTLLLCLAAQGKVEWPNKVRVAVDLKVTFDADSGLYTYAYTLTNRRGASQDLSDFDLPLRGATVVNVKSPRGWWALVTSTGNRVGWCACEEDGIVSPPGYIDDGRGLPSIYQIKPGQTLAGFSLQSAYPPSPGIFFAQGWVPTPIEGVDFPIGKEPDNPGYPANAFKGKVLAPARNEALPSGGRKPAVDGFLVFPSLRHATLHKAPMAVDIVFGQNGEVVDQSSFRAMLNDVDISDRFVTTAAHHRRAVLTMAPAGPLKHGKNVLVTTVEGVVSGGSKRLIDTDRIEFVAE